MAVDGNDSINTGFCGSPVQTISKGLEVALTSGIEYNTVWVGTGTYSGPIQLRNGISLLGGFSPSSDWVRDATLYTTSIVGGTVNGIPITVYGELIDSYTLFEGFVVQSGDAVSSTNTNELSSYGLHCSECADLVIRGNTISAGKGAPFANTALATRTDAYEGANGGGGQIGHCHENERGSGGSRVVQGNRFAGGSGGRGGYPSGSGGYSGQCFASTTAGGSGGSTHNNGSNGASGQAGTGGSGGNAAFISLGSPYFSPVPGGIGNPGLSGCGGGGGGGGGGDDQCCLLGG